MIETINGILPEVKEPEYTVTDSDLQTNNQEESFPRWANLKQLKSLYRDFEKRPRLISRAKRFLGIEEEISPFRQFLEGKNKSFIIMASVVVNPHLRKNQMIMTPSQASLITKATNCEKLFPEKQETTFSGILSAGHNDRLITAPVQIDTLRNPEKKIDSPLEISPELARRFGLNNSIRTTQEFDILNLQNSEKEVRRN